MNICVLLNVIHRNIFLNLKKKLFLFIAIKLNKVFLKFLSVLYSNKKNIFLNQINNVKKIISFI